MSAYTSGNSTVDAMSSMRMSGNIIPQSWYRHITKENGKPHLLAIVILADVVYWYRPQEIRDESTGQVIELRKKFADDMLQRSYEQYAEQFGESKRSITEAVIRLEKLGLIRREFRTIEINGLKCSNVLYIDLNVRNLFEVTFPKHGQTDTPLTKKWDRGHAEMGDISHKNGTCATLEEVPSHKKMGEVSQKNRRQIQENTLEISQEIISSSSDVFYKELDDEILKTRIDFINASNECPKTAGRVYPYLRMLVAQDKSYEGILTSADFLSICRNIEKREAVCSISDIGAYVRTCIMNMATGKKNGRKNAFGTRLKQNYDMSELENGILAN